MSWTRRPRRPPLLALAAAAAGAEAVARLVELRLGSYAAWHDQLTTGKWRQLRELRREPAIDVLLAGSSQMLTALDPLQLVPPPARCYNAALYRGVPTVMTEWLRHVALPATRPAVVVWGVSLLDLNDNGVFHAEVYRRFRASPAHPARRGAALRSHLALGRRAALLRRPRALLRTLRRPELQEQGGKPLAELLGPMGKGLEYVGFDSYRLSPEKEAFVRDEIANGFAMGGRQAAALREGAEAVRRFGARLILVEMPATDEFYAMYPRQHEDLRAARALLRQIADDCGAPFLPVDDDLPQDWFTDCVHLNGVGMHKWTELVAERLRAEGLLTA